MNFSEQRTPQEMSSLELKNQIGLLEKGGVSANELKVDYFLKFSIPATCLVFALIGLPLSLPSIRGGKMWGLVLSISIVFLFYFVASIFRSFGRGGVIPPLAGAWSAHIIFGVIGLILIVREGYFK
jgi:lipopolysaccharide export system permease protein